MMIFILLLFCFHTLASALSCLASETRPPLLLDCNELMEILRQQAQRPPERNTKRWGREEEDSPTSAELPKTYYIFRPGRERQSTCLVRMDALERPGVPNYDEFKFQRVVVSGMGITSICVARGVSGIDFPGNNEVVYVKVERASILPPWLQTGEFVGQISNVTIGNETAELRVFSGQAVSLDSNSPVLPATS